MAAPGGDAAGATDEVALSPTEAAAAAVSRVGDSTTRPPGPGVQLSPRLDWLLAGLSMVLVGGFYVDLWAHNHGRVDNTFFTPWHAFLYLGAASFGILLGGLGLRAMRRGASAREALPPPYRMSFTGSILFVVAGGFDAVWHSLFGFEVNTETLLSPAHLVLLATGLLMVGGAVVSVRSRPATLPASWRIRGPLVIGVTMAFAILSAFISYAHPLMSPWAEALPADEPSQSPAQLYAMAPDGSGQRRLIVTTANVVSPSLSADGKRLLFARTEDGMDQIFVRDLDTGSERRLTDGSANGRPRWSPDGTRILFESNRGDDYEVYVMAADGSGVVQLTDAPGLSWGASWSPDGASIAFNSDRGGNSDIYRQRADGSALVQLTTDPSDEYEPAWSPDGTLIAFNALGEHAQDRHTGYVISVIGADGSGPVRRLTDEADSYSATWSPDGSRIAFVSNRDGDAEIYSMTADGIDERNLTQNPGTDDGWLGLSWAPGGAAGGTILFASQAPVPWPRAETVRQNLGAASFVLQAVLVAAFILFLLGSGPLPIGALTFLIAVPVALTAVVGDGYRFILGALVAGVVADLLLGIVGYGRTRRRNLTLAFVLPALPTAAYFVTLSVTTGIGWTIHLWLGAIVLSGAVGLLLEVLVRSVRSGSLAWTTDVRTGQPRPGG